MRELEKEEMKNIDGGASATLITTVVAGIVIFITGILSGYSNPQKCNN